MGQCKNSSTLQDIRGKIIPESAKDAASTDETDRPEHDRIHMMLIEDAVNGLADVAAGNVKDARSAISAIRRRRSQ